MTSYKGIEITCDCEGYFCFEYKGVKYERDTLAGAKNLIVNLTKSYYKITKNDWDNLINKLSTKESDFVFRLLKEINHHSYNAYCELGITDAFAFDISDLDDVRYVFEEEDYE